MQFHLLKNFSYWLQLPTDFSRWSYIWKNHVEAKIYLLVSGGNVVLPNKSFLLNSSLKNYSHPWEFNPTILTTNLFLLGVDMPHDLTQSELASLSLSGAGCTYTINICSLLCFVSNIFLNFWTPFLKAWQRTELFECSNLDHHNLIEKRRYPATSIKFYHAHPAEVTGILTWMIGTNLLMIG